MERAFHWTIIFSFFFCYRFVFFLGGMRSVISLCCTPKRDPPRNWFWHKIPAWWLYINIPRKMDLLRKALSLSIYLYFLKESLSWLPLYYYFIIIITMMIRYYYHYFYNVLQSIEHCFCSIWLILMRLSREIWKVIKVWKIPLQILYFHLL